MRIRVESLRAFVCKYDLRCSVPVDLSFVKTIYDVRLVPFSPATLGFAFQDVIAINSNLHPYEQRMVLAHELAHKVLHHPNSLFLYRLGDWWYSHFEQEAQQGAAFILVPCVELGRLVSLGAAISEMEECFEVPRELIELKLRMVRLVS